MKLMFWLRTNERLSLKPASDELLHLDLVRFVASAGIVYHHSHEFFISPQLRSAVMARSSGLALFVDLFFVISGFVIAYVYDGKVRTFGSFMKFMQRRLGRLIPLHWLTLAISVAIFTAFAEYGFPAAHAPSLTLACIADTAFLLHGVVPCGTEYFNGVTWSISVEMCMYVAFPVFALLAARWKSFPLAAGLLIISGIIFHAIFSGTLLTFRWDGQAGLLRVIPSFLIGVGFYQFRAKLHRMPASPQVLTVSLSATIISMITGAPTLVVLLLVYLTAAAAIASDLQKASGTFVRRLAPLGQLTYSIYMWHGMFILLTMNVIADKLLHGATLPLILLTAVCYSGIAVWSYVSFIFIETPARRWIDRLSLLSVSPRKTA